MNTRRLLLIAMLSLALDPRSAFAQAGDQSHVLSVLAGEVTSAEEGAMEGVLVTAKKINSTIAITVVTDEKGAYHFPSSKLEPGRYAISIRAVGYDLDGPDAVDVTGQKITIADLKLRKTANLARQLTNAEWFESMPGTTEKKKALGNCVPCHMITRPIFSTHDADEFVEVQERMSHYAANSTPEQPQLLLEQRLANQSSVGDEYGLSRQVQARKQIAAFLSNVNLSKSTVWSYPLKSFPRPTGRATRVIITEYDLPQRTRQPHDVVVDSDGVVWYVSFGEQIIGKLDPKTGKTTEYSVPVLKPNSPKGELALRSDDDGNLWVGMMYQGAVGKFNKKTGKFQTFSLPPEDNKDYTQINQAAPDHSKVDGKVWLQDAGTYTLRQLDLATGKFKVYKPLPDPSPNIYDIISDAQNNGFFTVIGADEIGKINAKTGEISFYKTPTPDSGPRRGSIDSRGRIWFGEYRGNKIAMFDPETEHFQEWTPPTPWASPYDVVADKNGEAWAGSMFTDRVTRLNPKTGQMVDYLLPRSTNIRRVFVDNSTTPVTFWVGNNHGASIVKLEPLD